MEKGIYVGIELREDFSQASFYEKGEKEPVSVVFENDSLLMPTAIAMDNDGISWYIGNEAKKKTTDNQATLIDGILSKAVRKEPVDINNNKTMPVKIMANFFYCLLEKVKSAAGAEGIMKVGVTLKNFDISLLNIITKAMESIGIGEDMLELCGYDESFVYYALNQKEELWKNDVFLFDYDNDGLVVKRLYRHEERGKNVVMVHSDDYTDTMTGDMMNNNYSREYVDNLMVEIAQKQFIRKNISSVYLTGCAFKENIDLPGFVKCICDRKRAFAGNNMYCKGACYMAMGELKDVVLACSQRITTGVEIKISDRGREKIFRMIKPGVNWYKAKCSYDFIVNDCNKLEIFLSPLDIREKQLVVVDLWELPKRPPKTLRINVSFSFTSDSRCHMMVKDMGFGELFPSSGKILNEELLL